jgi:hypothetical protein
MTIETPPIGRPHHATSPDPHPFAHEQAGMFGFVAGHEPAVRRNDAPPRQAGVVGGQHVADKSGVPGMTGHIGDVTV